VVWRTECRRECNRIREASQPLKRCCNRDARSRGRFQRAVTSGFMIYCLIMARRT
jgi:hypothetical protein